MTASAAAQISLTNAAVSAPMENGFMWVRCQITNGTSRRIGWYYPAPIHLSYHWVGADGTVAVLEGLRTPLLPAIDPGNSETYEIKVAAPPEPGEYRLRITLVQDGVRWFDELSDAPGWIDIPIQVR